MLSRLLRFLLHSPYKACRARIGLGRLGACGNVIHFGHGQLAHGVLCVLRVAAAKVDILDVAHFEQKDVRGRRRGGVEGGVAVEVSCARRVWCDIKDAGSESKGLVGKELAASQKG